MTYTQSCIVLGAEQAPKELFPTRYSLTEHYNGLWLNDGEYKQAEDLATLYWYYRPASSRRFHSCLEDSKTPLISLLSLAL